MNFVSKKKHQKETAFELHEVIGGVCYICRQKLEKEKITKDHVFPKSMGYTIGYNMMPAHFECNRNKGNRMPTLEEIGLSMFAYETIGLHFDPKQYEDVSTIIYTKPIQHFIQNLFDGVSA